MTFEIHSDITNRSMTVAARAMRKVLRRKRSIIWAIDMLPLDETVKKQIH